MTALWRNFDVIRHQVAKPKRHTNGEMTRKHGKRKRERERKRGKGRQDPKLAIILIYD